MSWRKIVVDGQPYRWRGGRGGHLSVRGPDGKGCNAPLTQVTGWSWDNIERGHHKRYFCLTPRVVENFVRRVFLGEHLTLPPYGWSTPARD